MCVSIYRERVRERENIQANKANKQVYVYNVFPNKEKKCP